MRVPIVAAATVLLLLATCCGPARATPDTGSDGTSAAPDSNHVIIPAGAAAEFSLVFGHAVSGYWEPSSGQVAVAEERINQYLVAAQDDPDLDTYRRQSAAYIVGRLKEYRRQYVGIAVEGTKRIGCNAFISDHSHPDWARVPVFVLDGGADYWQIEYDLTKDECVSFSVHGEA
jgi:hypothetical protein